MKISTFVILILCFAIAQTANASVYSTGGKIGSYFFTPNRGDNANSITLIPSLETMVTIEAGPPGTKPSHMVPDSQGKYMFSINHGGNFVTVLDARTGKIVKSIVTGSAQSNHGQGCQYAWSKDGKKLWVTELDDNTMVEIDAVNLTVLRKVKVSDYPYGMVVAEDKGFAYVLGKKANEVAVVKLSDFLLVKTISVGRKPHAANYVAGKIYIGNIEKGEKSISVIDATRAELIKTIDIGFEDPHFIEEPVNNNLLIVASKKVAALVLIDIKTDKIVARFSGDDPEIETLKLRHPMWHSSGKSLYFPIGHKDGKGRIYQLSATDLKVLSISQPAATTIHMLQYNNKKNMIYAPTEGNPKKIFLWV